MVSFNVSQRSGAGRSGVVSADDSDYELSAGSHRKGRRSQHSSVVSRKDVYNHVDLDDLSSAPKISTDFTTDESSNQSADIIAETKFRMKSLEKEAQVHVLLFCFQVVKSKSRRRTARIMPFQVL